MEFNQWKSHLHQLIFKFSNCLIRYQILGFIQLIIAAQGQLHYCHKIGLLIAKFVNSSAKMIFYFYFFFL